jgi:crotonobetainyl-CoA:carnitine CoA-transferase CaiB-like acyl-CoA transferase
MEADDAERMGALSGLRVLDFSRFMPGAYFGWIAADLGADVILVDHPGQLAKARARSGDAATQLLRERQSWQRGKRSLLLDPSHPSAAPVMRALIERADVLIEDYRPGNFAAMGWSYEVAAAINPRLIYCSVSLAGHAGPYAGKPGHDPIALALSGALSRLTNSPRSTLPGLQVADVLGGNQATIAILAALQGRERDGRGRHIDCAMSDACMPLNAITLARYPDLDALGPPSGDWHPKGGVWECADGGFLCTTDMEPAYWRRFCDVIGRPDLAGEQQNTTRHAQMQREIAAILSTRPRDEWAALLDAADTQAMPVLSLAEAMRDPHNQARGASIAHGGHHHVGAPHGLGRMDTTSATATPGEHSAAILEELGLDAAALLASPAMTG